MKLPRESRCVLESGGLAREHDAKQQFKKLAEAW
jgi:hypothetical protein